MKTTISIEFAEAITVSDFTRVSSTLGSKCPGTAEVRFTTKTRDVGTQRDPDVITTVTGLIASWES